MILNPIHGRRITLASAGDVEWRWLPPPRALAVSPTSGPVEGETLVAVRAVYVWNVPALQLLHVSCCIKLLNVPGAQLAAATLPTVQNVPL